MMPAIGRVGGVVQELLERIFQERRSLKNQLLGEIGIQVPRDYALRR